MTSTDPGGPCQACERAPSYMAEPTEDPRSPILVCPACHPRLLACALRPREWFNLARRHGPQSALLHDDMYDEDGTACQPDEPVEDADAFPAPTLDEAAGGPASLLDFALTRWFIREALAERWRGVPPADAAAVLDERFEATTHGEIRSRILELAALTGADCAPMVRRAWQAWPTDVPWHALVEATAGCLPPDEGFDLAEGVLATMSERDWRAGFGALAYFRSARTLAWIATHARDPLVDGWGFLASRSMFDWPTAKAWLSGGRPLSLVAIDALVAIAFPRTLVDQRLGLKLAAAPGERELRDALEAALAADAVPRVRQRIGALLNHLAPLAAGSA